MDFDTEEERAKASASVMRGMSRKLAKSIFRQQIILTILQYSIAGLVLIIGILLCIFLNTFYLRIGSICINDIGIQNLDINIGTILILISIYMFMKITLNLNIKVIEGEQ